MSATVRQRPAWRQRVTAAAGRAARRLDLDRWDVLAGLGVVMLGAGLWIWLGLGMALSVVGGLLLALAVIGAQAGATAAADELSRQRGGR